MQVETCIPRVSVVTVVRNGAAEIARTLDSALAQRGVAAELVVIDGGSTDGTQAIVSSYGSRIATVVSGPDRGIYDAMNKGVARARGEFVLMMNGGDEFATDDALAAAVGACVPDVQQVVFGAWERVIGGGRRLRCTPRPERRSFNHQAILYSRSLHQRFGDYVCTPGFSTADYLFFCSVLSAPDVVCRTVDDVLARIDVRGVSAGLQTMSQKHAIDLLFGRASRTKLLAVLALHPAYHRLKRLLKGTT
jgi:glycosyltransferase involved in cell wall biosynthesis